MIPTDVFLLLLAAAAAVTALVYARRDPHRIHITPVDLVRRIHAWATARPAGWWRVAGFSALTAGKLLCWLALGLLLSSVAVVGVAAKVLATAAEVLCIGAAFLLWHTRALLREQARPRFEITR
ncbi:hypothetical protein [Streptosporangium sp. NPDC051022]|uniref:hypothetical protein n=1 Tax=Streptosporangium sp. NPDC051022 TaxID=3155752 RepID=UPI003421AB83